MDTAKPNLEIRHRRLHVAHENAQYVVFTREHLVDSRFGSRTYWAPFEHVVDDRGTLYAGGRIVLSGERVVLSVEITSEDFDRVLARVK